jgi:hypothetical protein
LLRLTEPRSVLAGERPGKLNPSFRHDRQIPTVSRYAPTNTITTSQIAEYKADTSVRSGQSSELICFRLDESRCLGKIESLGIPGQEVQALPMGSFIALNRLSRQRIEGKVF